MIEKIEAVFEDIADALLNENSQLSITLKIRPKPRNGPRSSTDDQNATDDAAKRKQICFPGKTAEEAWRFSMHGETTLVLVC